jgi:multidrug efflux pump subunit AcrA (membrane-fusion protein)
MKTLLAILNDFKIFFNPKTKFGRKRSLIALALLLIAFLGVKFFGGQGNGDDVPPPALTQVSVLSVSELGSKASFDTVGKVEAVSEANLQSEAGGRVTSVYVNVGDSVSAGKVLATIENNSQAATLTQAQGAYEAALAASAQSGVGLNESATALTSAKNGVVNTYRQAYNTVNSAVYNSIDTFFSSPQSSLPGLRLDGMGNTAALNSERVAYQQLLTQWQARSNSISVDSDLKAELAYARTQVERTITFLDTFITILNSSDSDGTYSDAKLQTYSTNFTTLRSSLIAIRSSIDGALSGLNSAEDAALRSQLSASGGTYSASDAQVKIALGSLQAAQANYQKTIVRSPIQGVVNAFYLKTGDYTSPGQPAGIVANNNGLQIKTFVSEIDSANLNVGDVVTIEGGASGVITAKAAALDPANGKVAIVVGVNPDSGLTNGATVSLTFSQISEVATTDRILVPLSALKITSSGSFVFTVSEEKKLVAIAVTQGQLYGENIEILSGLTKDTRIVTDARGLKEDQLVTVK